MLKSLHQPHGQAAACLKQNELLCSKPASCHAAAVSPVHHDVLAYPLLIPLSTCLQEDEKPDNFDMSDMQNLQQFGGGE